MNKHYWLTVACICLFLSASVHAQTNQGRTTQLRVNKNTPLKTQQSELSGITTAINSASALIENTFVGNNCAAVSNITSTGNAGALGSFSNGMTSIGMEEGLLLSTGHVANAVGPNANSGTTFNWPNNGYDVDLQQIAGSNTIHDVAKIEFDFTPTVSIVTFEFVFASEEYCEYVNSPYNDVFGLFVSGPGIGGSYSGGAQNVALIPGTGTPVSVANVNHTVNQNWYIGSIPAGDPSLNHPNCTGHPGGTGATNHIEYDGFTKVMTATLNFIPCQTYHFKMAIADVYDDAYDSAIFLKAKSFQIGGQVDAVAIVPSNNNSSTAFEGCSDGYFEFTRTDNDTSLPVTLNYALSPGSTATPGIDFATFPMAVTIPAGQMSVQVPIEVYADQLSEGNESIILDLAEPCNCSLSTVEMIISDTDAISIQAANAMICEGETANLSASVSGGVPGVYTYNWSNGATTSSISVSPLNSTTYTVTVSDQCGNSNSHAALVTVFDNPTAEIVGNETICANGGNPAIIQINFSESGIWQFVYSINGIPQPALITANNPFQLQAFSTGVYEILSATSPNGCPVHLLGTAQVTETQIDLSANLSDVNCYGGNDGYIELGISGGTAPYSFLWSNGDINQNPTNLPQGNYSVTVTDANGCTQVHSTTLNEPTELIASITGTSAATCANPTGGTISTIVSGGTSPYQYMWSNGANYQNPIGLPAGYYTLTVTDANNCTTTTSGIVISDMKPPIAEANAFEIISCYLEEALISGAGSTTSGNMTYEWTTTDGSIVSDVNTLYPTVNQGGTYELTVTNLDNGCTATATAQVFEDTEAPFGAAIPSGDLTCKDTLVTIDGSYSNSGSAYAFLWSTAEGNILSPNNVHEIEVNAPGMYELVVTNMDNGCTSLSETEIYGDYDLPQVEFEVPDTITCIKNEISLDASNSDTGSEFMYQWTTVQGNIISSDTSLITEANQAGFYTLTISNTTNGCVVVDSIKIEVNQEPPIADAGSHTELNCYHPTLLLNAENSSIGSEFQYTWNTSDGNILSGAYTLFPEIDAPGTYELSVQNSQNGCFATSEALVTANFNSPVPQIAPAEILNCQTESLYLNATASQTPINSSFQWTTSNGNILNGDTSLLAEINQPGIYNLQITNLNSGCTENQNIEIIGDFESPIVTINTPELITCDLTEINLIAVNSSQGATFSYEWSTLNGFIVSGENTLIPTVSAAGNYELSVTDLNNFCTTQAAIEVLADADFPQVDAGEGEELDCGNPGVELNGSISGNSNLSFEWTSTDGNFTNNQNSLNPEVDAPGVYVLTVTNSENQCSASSSVTITANFNSPLIHIETPEIITCNKPTQILNASNSDFGQNFQINWSTINGNFLINQNSLTPEIDQPGIYELTLQNEDNQCISSQIVEVFENKITPEISIAEPLLINCENPIITLESEVIVHTQNLMYQWQSSNGNIVLDENTASIEVNQAGIYELEVVDVDNGCTGNAVVEVFSNLNYPSFEILDLPILTCASPIGSIEVQAAGNFENVISKWQSADGNILSDSGSLNIQIDAVGNYTLLTTDTISQCTTSQSIEIQEDVDLPIVLIEQEGMLDCDNMQAVLNAENSSNGSHYIFDWYTSNGNFVSSTDVLNPGIDAPGIYTLTITNQDNNCQNSASIEVEMNAELPLLEITMPGKLTCTNPNLKLQANADKDNLTIYWTTQTGTIESGAESWNPIVSAEGMYQIHVAHGSGNCMVTDSVFVEADFEIPISQIELPQALNCNFAVVTLDAGGSTSGSNINFVWSTQNGNILSGQGTAEIEVNGTGVYELLVTNTENGCSSNSEVEVAEDFKVPVINIAPVLPITCSRKEVTIDATASDSGSPYSISWTTINGNILSGEETLSPIVNLSAIYQLQIIDNSNGCTNTKAVAIKDALNLPAVDAGDDVFLLCDENKAVLDASNSDQGSQFIVNWTTEDGVVVDNQNSLTPTVSGAGSYFLTVQNIENDCSAIDSVVVSQIEGLNATIEVTQPKCHDDFGKVTIQNTTGGTAPYLFSIDGGNHFFSEPLFKNLPTDNYSVVIEDINGCLYEAEVYVQQPAELKVELNAEKAIVDLGETVQLNASVNEIPANIQQITWTPSEKLSCSDCLQPIAKAVETTHFEVEVTNESGCIAKSELTIQVNSEAGIYVPNAFSPNGDGHNDYFTIFSREGAVAKIDHLLIFDRWGEQVASIQDFSANNPKEGWDGRFNGKISENAVYLWLAELEMSNGKHQSLTGSVTLLKH